MSDEKDDRESDDKKDPTAKDELFEAIDHFRNAASILFDRAAKDPTLRSATKEAEKVVKKVGDAAEPVVKKVGDAAEPLAKQLAGELSKLTRNVMEAVEGKRKSESAPPKSDADDKGKDKDDK